MRSLGFGKGWAWALGFVGAGVLAFAGTVLAEGQEGKKETRPVINESQVYFGKAATCKAPAVVDGDRVFSSIPEYRRILEKKLTEKDVEYSMLMLRATRRFRSAIESAASEAGCDLVGNIGSVTWEGHEVPDLTERAIQKFEEPPR
jgi:hypothetical protein